MDEQLRQSALEYHRFPTGGKIQVAPTKPLATQRDLALAYSPAWQQRVKRLLKTLPKPTP